MVEGIGPGLVAIGTSLDPATCANNRMVGSIAGPSGCLPPVFGPSLFLGDLGFVNTLKPPDRGATEEIKAADLLQKGSEILCHLGSITMKAKVKKISKSSRRMEVVLYGPVCAARGSNVAIEAKIGRTRNFRLVAHAKLVDGDVCMEDVGENTERLAESSEHSCEPSHTVIKMGDLHEKEAYWRTKFINDLAEHNGKAEGNSRVSIPRPEIVREGATHVVSNFGLIAHSLRRPPDHFESYLIKEGGLSTVLTGNHSSPAKMVLRVKRQGRDFPLRVSSILKNYILTYVTCNQCHGAVTELLTNRTELLCRRCNARRFVEKV